MQREGSLERYVPVDLSECALADTTNAIDNDYPKVLVTGIVADLENQINVMLKSGPLLIAFLGSTIGNLEPAARARFLSGVRTSMREGDYFLVGIDLVKDPRRIVSAYDDDAGVTANFNRNILRVINRRLGGNFQVERFDHIALWDPEQEWIEMRLRSRCAQRVNVSALHLEISYAAGEEMRTEISAKFRRSSLEAEFETAGFRPAGWWEDRSDQYALSLWSC
jgi:L-histidine N-alpha-methyltransferase